MEDDLDDILNESAKEFDKKLTLNEEKKTTEEPKPQPHEGFKQLLEGAEGFDFEKMGFNKEEFEKANELFSNMMKDMDKADASSDSSNPFLQEYMQDREKDKKTSAIPDNIGDILNDKEF